jgi:hypothetical protein
MKILTHFCVVIFTYGLLKASYCSRLHTQLRNVLLIIGKDVKVVSYNQNSHPVTEIPPSDN